MLPITPGSNVDALNNDTSGQPEQSYVECVAEGAVFESLLVTCPAGDAAAQGDFLHIVMPDGTKIIAWLDIDSDGTAPNGAVASAADDAVAVAVTLTGTPSTAIEVAAAMKTALEGSDLDDFTIVDNLDGTLTITCDVLGNPTNSAVYAEDEVAASSIELAVTGGVASSLNDKYITFNDNDNDAFYAWFNVNGEGSDPAPAGTGIEVALAGGETAAEVGIALAAAIDAHAEFEAEHDGAGRVKISTIGVGVSTNIDAGDSGFRVYAQSEGRAASKPSPGSATSGLTNI